MTPKEKARELFDKFYNEIPAYEMAYEYDVSKECALIAANEVSDELTKMGILSGYWFDVKEEIQKL